MKKILFCLFCLAVSVTAFSQTNKSFVIFNNSFYQLPILQLPTSSTFIAFTSKNVSTFSIYNNVTGLNDTYNSTQSSYYYSAPTFEPSNQSRGVKIDSFNPHGSHNLGNAVVSGLFSLLLN